MNKRLQKRFQQLRQRARDLSVAVGATVATGLAMAGAPADPFDTAVDTITDAIGGYGAALVAVAAVGVTFMVAMKYVKKIPRAA